MSLIRMNWLKEGLGVTNLHTIARLRALASGILVEQTMGRGLRLPYGQRTRVETADRLTIIAHDRLNDDVKAERDSSPLILVCITVIVGGSGNISEVVADVVGAHSNLERLLTGVGGSFEKPEQNSNAPFGVLEEREIVRLMRDVIQSSSARSRPGSSNSKRRSLRPRSPGS
jgi:type III restriction enzyme